MILNVALDLPDDGAFLRVARRVGRTLLEDLGVVEDDIADIEFVVGELCSNVIRHAQSSDGRFMVRLEYHADKVMVIVEDKGAGFSFKDVRAVGTERPDLNGETRLGGFGLEMVAQLADHLAFTRRDEQGTTVEAEMCLHYRSQAARAEAEELDRPDGGNVSVTTG